MSDPGLTRSPRCGSRNPNSRKLKMHSREEKPPHPNPLPTKAWGEGTRKRLCLEQTTNWRLHPTRFVESFARMSVFGPAWALQC